MDRRGPHPHHDPGPRLPPPPAHHPRTAAAVVLDGTLRPDERGVSVIGSRQPTPRCLSIAATISEALARHDISVISGVAAGIDTAAHTAALRAGGRPIGVIGTGIDRVYPAAASCDLHRAVAARGALVSQFLPDASPHRDSFRSRNATMSGLSDASIIVEAGEHSGTRVQARAALAHGRAVILTDHVADATLWTKELRGRPGVHIAGSTGEVIDILDGLIATDSTRLAVLPKSTGRQAEPV